jgi:hypothetical protein
VLVLLAACGPKADRSAAAGAPDTAMTPAAPTPAPPATDTQAAPAAKAPAPTTAATPAPKPKPAPKKAAPAPAPTTTAAAPSAAADTATKDTGTKAPAAAGKETAAATQTADAPLRDAYHQPPKDTVGQATYDGWKQFNLNCARCHGEDVSGTTIAPHLIVSLRPDGAINTKELFMQVVCAGRPEKGMPAWCALGMDMQKIDDIYSYVKGRSDGKIHPGRPAVKAEG